MTIEPVAFAGTRLEFYSIPFASVSLLGFSAWLTLLVLTDSHVRGSVLGSALEEWSYLFVSERVWVAADWTQTTAFRFHVSSDV